MDIQKYKIILPNMVTSLSILCGIFAIFFCVNGDQDGRVELACWLVIFAALIDGLDGKVARMTNTSSEFGIQFDSIADVLTFGAATAVILYSGFFNRHISGDHIDRSQLFYFFPVIYLLCGAIRLARFNLTATTQSKSFFYGMPIPTAAVSMVSMVLAIGWLEESGYVLPASILLRVTVFYTLFISLMMISTVRCERPYGFFFKEARRHYFRSAISAGFILLLFVVPSLAFFGFCLFYGFYSLVSELSGAHKDGRGDSAAVQFE